MMTPSTQLTCAALALSFTPAIAQDVPEDVTPALAGEWIPFGIRKYGFIFDVPPGFLFVTDHKYDGGEGALFQNDEGDFVVVWGIDVDIRDFQTHVKELMQIDMDEGWNFTYQRLTPKWAVYSGIKDDWIRYVKSITVCDDRAAFFVVEYERAEKRDYDPIVTQMEKSLKREGC